MSPEQASRLARSLLDEVWCDDAESALIAVGDVIAGYEIEAHIASGGTCDVYRARSSGHGVVALKVLKEALPPEIEWRVFEREAMALARLDHPTIARLVGSGRLRGGRGILAIEFVEGQRLTSRVGEADLRSLLQVFAEICEGVEHAHLAGVIHRDLKPSNILIDASGRPRIVDFGVSLPALVHRRSPLGVWSGGTLAYMSPEQIGMAPWELDSRTDVFSLGVILHQLLSGRLPFDTEGVHGSEAIERIRAGGASLGRRGGGSVLRGLEEVVARALAFDRDLRYQSAGELGLAARAASNNA